MSNWKEAGRVWQELATDGGEYGDSAKEKLEQLKKEHPEAVNP